jgi:hypothetical protein
MTPNEVDYLVDASKHELKNGGVYVEMGAFAMGTIGRVAEANAKATCWAVDLFDHRYLDEDGNTTRWMIENKYPNEVFTSSRMNEIIMDVKRAFPNIKMKMGRSRSFFMHNVQMQFIDADHCYDEVIADFWHAWSQAAPGGLIMGHDHYPDSDVEKAVADISKILGEPGFGVDSLWFYRKTK